MQPAFALAQRAITSCVSSTLLGTRALASANIDSYSLALSIVASKPQRPSVTKSLTSVFGSRLFSQAAVSEPSQADIQLTEAAVEVRVLFRD